MIYFMFIYAASPRLIIAKKQFELAIFLQHEVFTDCCHDVLTAD
jgi:hypothetical protein